MIRPMGGLGATATCASGSTAFDTGRGYAICMDDESDTPTGEIVPTASGAAGTPKPKQASMLGTVDLSLNSPIVIAAIVGLAFVMLSRR